MHGPDPREPSPDHFDDRNVVLFNHASIVEPDVAPEGVTVEARIPAHYDDEHDQTPTATIWEFVETDSQPTPEAATRDEANPPRSNVEDIQREADPPTLQLDVDSIVILDIHRMKPFYTQMSTRRVRHNKSHLLF